MGKAMGTARGTKRAKRREKRGVLWGALGRAFEGCFCGAFEGRFEGACPWAKPRAKPRALPFVLPFVLPGKRFGDVLVGVFSWVFFRALILCELTKNPMRKLTIPLIYYTIITYYTNKMKTQNLIKKLKYQNYETPYEILAHITILAQILQCKISHQITHRQNWKIKILFAPCFHTKIEILLDPIPQLDPNSIRPNQNPLNPITIH